ncbi:MAG: hypothetical protein ACI4MH_01475 [Candidatus Coproplasma sp.]
MLFYDDYNGCEDNKEEDLQMLCGSNQFPGAFAFPCIVIRKNK